MCEPWEIATKQGKPFQVFTPYWRAACGPDEPASPLPAPKHIPGGSPTTAPHSEPLDALQLEPTIDWAAGMREHWHPGEVGAIERLQQFVAQSVAQYADHRDLAAVDGVSQLSPHLHFGELGPRQVWHAVQERVRYAKLDSDGRRGAEAFLTEIGWREFAHHLLFHFPHTTDAPLREKFANFPWVDDHTALRRWQRGLTGYPMVDAGMRQLWRLGWMHNRVRMIVASFLVKDLLVSWREGARWFWDTLVDADLANNTLGWQWTAGCGADAAPFFRIFNPTIQGEKLDPAGDYVRRWVPELSRLPTEWIHRPWQAPADVLKLARVELDRTYPRPMVDHDIARRRALQVLKSLQASNS